MTETEAPMLKRFIPLFLVLACITACRSQKLDIYNGCYGSWVNVRDGDGEVLATRIDYGQTVTVDLGRFANRQLSLIASGFSLSDGHPLGSATWSQFIEQSSGNINAPQLQPWQITYLQANGPNTGCGQ